MNTIEKNKTTTTKDTVRDAIYAQRDQLVQLAREIHEHPQLAFTEEYAAARITEFLADEGFDVRSGVYGLPTAFVVSIGNGPLHVAFCAEYDALPPSCLGAISFGGTSSDQSKPGLAEVWLSPECQDTPLWHGCGHNVIAGAAVTAATGLRGLADEVGLTVSVFGTPGEELLGLPEPPDGHMAAGKIALLEAGAFEGVHAALMVHPSPTPYGSFVPTYVYLRQRARFSHAGADGRHLGVSELRMLEEALKQTVLSFQQTPALYVAKPEEWNAGAQVDLVWIAPSLAEGMRAGEALRRCFEEEAARAGIAVEVTDYATDIELRNDPRLSASYRENAIALGRVRERDEAIREEIRALKNVFLRSVLRDPRNLKQLFTFARHSPVGLFLEKMPAEIMYGTDLANVSQVIPTIHPFIGIGGMAAVHSVEFAAQADTDEAYRAMLDAGVALAWTALDAATDPALRAYLLEAASSRVGPRPTTA
jgi:metal-dependent amidase/aminoacylase/carboxypeptidase family protein